MPGTARYEIRIAHALDEMTARAFEGLELRSLGQITVIGGELDQAALHGLLERIRSMHLELIEATRVPEPPAH